MPKCFPATLLFSGCCMLAAFSSASAADPTAANDDFGAAPRSGDTTIDVLANDTSAAGVLTITSATEPKSTDSDTAGAVAGVAIVSNGKIIYRPSGLAATATFNYTISDANGTPATATVHVIAAAIAKADSAFVSNISPVRVAVLQNDKFAADSNLIISGVTKPTGGTVKINSTGDAVTYSPGASFTGSDSFQYTIRYDFGTTSTATVTVFAPGLVIEGPLGANILDKSGAVIGYIYLTATRTGAFSGKVEIGREKYALLGAFDVKGHYVGYAVAKDGSKLALSLDVKNASGGAEFAATFGGSDEWSVTQKVDTLTSGTLETLDGRYTVELVGSDSSTTSTDGSDGTTSTTSSSSGGAVPQGVGWMTIKVNKYGNANIKGRTGDGRSFSTGGQIVGTDAEPELPFRAAWDNSEIAGTLKIGETISGDLHWVLLPNHEDRYPKGFDATVSATGGVYIKPDHGDRALSSDSNDAGRVSIAVSGGGATEFSREMRLSEGDDASPIIEGPDQIEFDIDRGSGTFKGKFRDIDDREKRIKFTGVLLQGESRGVGLFEGDDKTGKVEITLSSETTTGLNSGN